MEDQAFSLNSKKVLNEPQNFGKHETVRSSPPSRHKVCRCIVLERNACQSAPWNGHPMHKFEGITAHFFVHLFLGHI
jgi:hypothetical protein